MLYSFSMTQTQVSNQIPHFNVVIATPGFSMLPGYVKSLVLTTNYLTQKGISWNYLSEYSSLVAHAREKTIAGPGAMDKGDSRPGQGAFTYDKIIWIDSDIAWDFEDFMRIYDAKEDIVSGCYLMENGEVTVYPQALQAGMSMQAIMALKSRFTVRGVGFGFLAVRSGVFEKMARPWFSQIEVEIENPDTGEIEYKFPLMGEDLSWCEKAHRIGFDIWVDPLVRVTHHKQIKLEWPR
jgi:hypothetical protein